MTTPRRVLLVGLALSAGLLWTGCATTTPAPSAADRQALAPTGTLRIGVYAGSPTSLVRDAGGQPRGVSVDIGRQLAQRLGVGHELVEFPRVAAVLDALKAGQVDFTVTNATPARAADMNFSAPLVELELGYLVLPGSKVSAVGDVDRPGVRVGVSQGSTSQRTLGAAYKNAAVVPAPSLRVAADMLRAGQLDAFATNKAILHEMADGLPGARILDGRWGVEQLAIAIPKGRESGMDFVRRYAEQVKADGLVQRAAERAGLRGTVPVAVR